MEKRVSSNIATIATCARTFDKIVSLGMVEHVGREQLAPYFDAAFRALCGRPLPQPRHRPTRRRQGYRTSGFMGRYVFPDGDLLHPPDAARNARDSRSATSRICASTTRRRCANGPRIWKHRATRSRDRRANLSYLAPLSRRQRHGSFARGRMALSSRRCWPSATRAVARICRRRATTCTACGFLYARVLPLSRGAGSGAACGHDHNW